MNGVTYIDNTCIGKYALRNCLILIDEGTLFADSRQHKTFDIGKMTFFLSIDISNAILSFLRNSGILLTEE